MRRCAPPSRSSSFLGSEYAIVRGGEVRAPEGSRVSEVSDGGMRLGVSSELTVEAHLVLITQLQSTMKHNETTELCLLCAYYLRLGACALLAPCSPETVLSSKLRTVRHLVTALSHWHRECLRRSLGHTSSMLRPLFGRRRVPLPASCPRTALEGDGHAAARVVAD